MLYNLRGGDHVNLIVTQPKPSDYPFSGDRSITFRARVVKNSREQMIRIKYKKALPIFVHEV